MSEQGVFEVTLEEQVRLAEVERYRYWLPSDFSAEQRTFEVLFYSTTFGLHLPTEAEMRAQLDESDRKTCRFHARAFAKSIRDLSGVQGIWFHDDGTEALLTVVTSDFDLDRDLQIQAAFVRLQQSCHAQERVGLEIYAEPEGVPSSAMGGERL